MSIINIYDIIRPITDEIRRKAIDIVNDVSGRVWNIVSIITGNLRQQIAGVVYDVGNMLQGVMWGLVNAVNHTRNVLEDKLNYVISSVNNIVSSISNSLNGMRQSIQELVNSMRYSIENKLNEVKYVIEYSINNIMQRAVGTIQGYINQISNKLSEVFNQIHVMKDTIVSMVSQGIAQSINSISTKITTSANDIIYRVQNSVENIRSSIENKIAWVQNQLTNLGLKVENTITGVKNYVFDQLNYAREQISIRINEIRNSITAFIEDTLSRLRNRFETTLENVRDFIKGQLDLLQEKISDVKRSISDRIDKIMTDIQEMIDHNYQIAKESFEAQFKEFSRVFSKLTNNQYTNFDTFIKDFNDIGGEGGILSALVGSIVIGSVFLNAAVTIGQPMSGNLRNLAMAEYTPNILPPNAVIELLAKRMIGEERAFNELALSGLNKERATLLKNSYTTPISAGSVQQAFLRGEISEARHDELLRELHYSNSSIELFKELYVILPPIQDIITMSVREVFSPETAERFGQFEDFPENFAGFAAQQGLSREWAKNYWAAHWSLPSPTQGFEMLHRRIIDNDDLKMLLKALDIMPFWREKLIQLSYNPLTRVDVRRMHKVGVLSEAQVYEAYLDIGYTPENANRLTEFTVKLNSAENKPDNEKFRQLSQNIIQQAYIRGFIDRSEALTRLQGIGYTANDAEFLLRIQDSLKQIESNPDRTGEIKERTSKMVLKSYGTRILSRDDTMQALIQLGLTQLEAALEIDHIDYEIELKLKHLYVKSIQELYTNWVIERSDVFIYLNDLGFLEGEIEAILQELEIIRNTRTKLPTMADLKRWVGSGILTIEQYVNELKGQGFADKYIERYVMDIVGSEG